MKKWLVRLSLSITLLLVALVAAFVAVNLVDAPAPEGAYALQDLPAASLDPGNGYFQYLALTYPADRDITSPEIMVNMKKMSDPGLLQGDFKEIMKLAARHRDLYARHSLRKPIADPLAAGAGLEQVAGQREMLEQKLKEHEVLVNRHSLLLRSGAIEDFSLPSPAYPAPHDSTFVKTAGLFIDKALLTILEGKWEEGVSELMRQFHFCRRFSAASRHSMNKAVTAAVMSRTLKTLAWIMNQKDCPPEIFTDVLEGLPPMAEGEIGLRHSLIFEYLTAVQGIEDILKSNVPPFGEIGVLAAGFFPSTPDCLNFLAKFRIFLNRNRTTQIYLDELNRFLELEKTPPFRWRQDPLQIAPPDLTRNPFWWFSNPVGKAIANFGYGGFPRLICRKYEIQAAADLVRIAAEFRLKYSPGESASAVYRSLENASVMDPFSGKPYLFNERKLVIYSIGSNRMDDGGEIAGEAGKEARDIGIGLGRR